MALLHLLTQAILAYLSLPITAQTNPIEPISSTAATTNIPSTTTTVASATSPTPVPGDDTYLLIGCYNEPPASASARALGATGSYLTPTFDSQDALTVPLCLEACGVALAPDGSGTYAYAGVENSRECYCGLTLSELSNPVTEGYCSSPCAADGTAVCGGYGYISLYQRRSTLNGTNSTSRPTASPTSSVLPTSSTRGRGRARSRGRRSSGFWIGISLGIFFFLLLLALALIWHFKRRHASRRDAALSNAGLSTRTPSFLGGFSLMHPSQKRNRPVNAVYTEDGRRFGIVVDDNATTAGSYVSPMEESPHPRIQSRPTFDEWKSGAVAPARVPDGPSAINHSVELDSIISPVAQLDNGLGVAGAPVEQTGYETPIAELADSRLPTSVDGRERGSVDIDGVRDTRPDLDNRDLEKRLKELGGLSPVSEASGLQSRMSSADAEAGPIHTSQR